APASHGHSDFSRALSAASPHVSLLQEANKALRAIAAVARRDELERLAQTVPAPPERTPVQQVFIDACLRCARTEATALNEVESKLLLREYGIATPREVLVTIPEDALRAAAVIGYPVVLKAVSKTLTHKSDMGAVALNIAT